MSQAAIRSGANRVSATDSSGRRALACGLVGLLLAVAACSARPPEPLTLKPRPALATGLRLVETDENGLVAVQPGVRMSDYTELIVDPFMLSYTSGEGQEETLPLLDREVEERFTRIVREAVVAQMRKSRDFRLVDQAGAGAMRVQGWLYDLILDETLESDREFPLCFAKVTVLLTVRDSATAVPLAEIADRTLLDCPTDKRGRAKTTWKAVRKGVDVWAVRLRRWLEDLHALPPIEG